MNREEADKVLTVAVNGYLKEHNLEGYGQMINGNLKLALNQNNKDVNIHVKAIDKLIRGILTSKGVGCDCGNCGTPINLSEVIAECIRQGFKDTSPVIDGNDELSIEPQIQQATNRVIHLIGTTILK